MADRFSEEKYLDGWMREFSRRIVPVFYAWGVRRMHANQLHALSNKSEGPFGWRLGWRGGSKGRHSHRTELHFDAFRYVGGNEEEAPTQRAVLSSEPAWQRTFDARNGKGFIEEIDDSVEIIDQSAVEYTADASLRVSQKMEVKAEASVGDIASASATSTTEYEATASFGTRHGSEYSKKSSHSIKTIYEIDDDEYVQLSVDRTRVREVTPIVENGVLECSLKFDLYDWTLKNSSLLHGADIGKGRVLEFASIQEFLGMLHGDFPRRFPNMNNFERDARKHNHYSALGSRQFIDWLKDEKRRTVKLHKQRVHDYDEASEIRSRDLLFDESKGGED